MGKSHTVGPLTATTVPFTPAPTPLPPTPPAAAPAPTSKASAQGFLPEGVGFRTPESVLYDPKADLYLVANIHGDPSARDVNGFISRISPEGQVVALNSERSFEAVENFLAILAQAFTSAPDGGL